MDSARHLISLAHLTLPDTSPPDLVRAAAAAGFDAVGIRLGRGSQASDPTWPMLGDTAMLHETQHALAESGLSVLEVEGVSILPDRTVDSFRHLPNLLESAAVLGAQFLTVASFDSDLERTANELVTLCAMCAPYGLHPIIEFFSRSSVPTLHDAVELVKTPGCERASVLLDVLHFVRSGGAPRALDEIHIGLLQLCDAPLLQPNDDAARRTESRHRLLPGEGQLPLDAILRNLSTRVPISVEAPSDRYATCAADERAQLAMIATRTVLHQ